MPHIKISIITVVLNDEPGLFKTINSVLSQNYNDIEFIVIDGDSTDNTLNLIKSNHAIISHFISEKDNGIYDAMNKGIDLASGDWIIFMNAGDTFYSREVISNIFENNNYINAQIIYGDTQVSYPSKDRTAKAGELKMLWKGSQFCHQSVFTSSTFQKANKFNTSNIIGADFELFYTAFRNNFNFMYLNTTIATISSGGVSDIKRISSALSHWKVVGRSPMINLYYCLRIFKEWAKIVIKKLIGMHH